MYIDTHAHLYDEQLAAIEGNVEEAVNAGVTKMMMPNCFSSTVDLMMAIADKHPANCFPMMGLHPTYVKENYKTELDNVVVLLEKQKFYGIGEVGLDYYWDMTYEKEQKEAFDFQIALATKYQLPVIIHSRESVADCIAMIEGRQNGSLTGIFHCFSGNLEEAKQVISLGFYLGIGGTITYKKSLVPEVVAQIPLDHLVLETDAPYLAPVPHRGKMNKSSYIPLVAQAVAEIKKVSLQHVAETTTRNAENIFHV